MTEKAVGNSGLSAPHGAEDFARSELFARMFQEGMGLVEETASYLDGKGREDSKLLSRNAALAYAGESMRLTTRLMQVASWLLVQRAVREGELEASEAAKDKYRLGLRETDPDYAERFNDALPEMLRELMKRSERLFERVAMIDRKMFRAGEAPLENAVGNQLSALQDAFAQKK